MLNRLLLASLGAVSMLANCNQEPSVAVAEIKVVSRPADADTIQARLAEPLVVKIANVPEGTVVRFDTYSLGSTPFVRVGAGFGQPASVSVADTTGADGEVRIWITMGELIGAAKIVIVVPEYGLLDSGWLHDHPRTDRHH